MEANNPNTVHNPEGVREVLCPNCLSKISVLPAESATCACKHRFPLADPDEKGPVMYIDGRGRPI